MNKVEFQEQIEQISKDFITLKIVESIINDKDLKELNFFKQIVELPNGGRYLLHFQHLEGPKILLSDYSKVVEEIHEES